MTVTYTTGTITLTNGQKAVVGTGTGWSVAGIVSGVIFVQGVGNPLPFSAITDDTHLTADIEWTGPNGSYAYAMVVDTSSGRQTVANMQALATYIQRLDNASLAALASLSGTMVANRIMYATSGAAAAWTPLTAFMRSLLDDGDAATARATLGNVFAKNLPIANDYLTGGEADFNALPGPGLWQLDRGGNVPNLNGPTSSLHHIVLQIGNEYRGLQIAGDFGNPNVLWFRIGGSTWGAWRVLLSDANGSPIISTSGGNEADITTSAENRLSIDFTAVRPNIMAVGAIAIRNTVAAEPWVTCMMVIRDLTSGAEFINKSFPILTPGTNGGRFHPSIPLTIGYSGLTLGRAYRIIMYVWKDAAVGPIYPTHMSIVAINS